MIRPKFLTCMVLLVIVGSSEGWETFNKEDCKLSAETGPCSLAVTRYFFDYAIKACKRFTYSGCNGNNNRFSTIGQCIDNCGGVDICHQPPPDGNCGDQNSRRYCFDKYTGVCTEFNYLGCTDSLNIFGTLAACEAECSGRIECVGDSKPH